VLTRNALLAIVPFGADNPLSGWFEIYQRKPAKAIQLILHAAPHPMTSQAKCPGWKAARLAGVWESLRMRSPVPFSDRLAILIINELKLQAKRPTP
jgi:hypothetical protein